MFPAIFQQQQLSGLSELQAYFLALSTISLSKPKFEAIDIALLNPGIPIRSLYVGCRVSVLNSTEAFLKKLLLYSKAFNSP